MAFINIDLYLVDLYCNFFTEVQADPARYMADIFGDRPDEERQEIAAYLAGLNVTKDIRERDEAKRYLYVLPSFPLVDIPFPQIGVFMGPEDSQDFFLGSSTGVAPVPVLDADEKIVAYDQEEGYFAGFNYRSDIFCNSRDETIWLSRICQRAVAGAILELDAMGIKEPRIGLSELEVPKEHFPTHVSGRTLTLSGKVLHTWHRRTLAGTYETGSNIAL